MSDAAPTASVLPTHLSALVTTRPNQTERNFLRAMLYCAACVFVFWCGYYFERSILNRHPADIRFIREASEAAMRYITIPHILIGFLFMISSPKNQTAQRRRRVGWLLLAGAGLCALYGLGGGKANVLCYLGVYLYFLVHELRDEAMFYTVLGDAAPISDRAAFDRMVQQLIVLLVLGVAAIGWSLVPWGAYHDRYPQGGALFAGTLAWPIKLLVGSLPLLLIGMACRRTLGRAATALGHADRSALLRAHATLFRVMIGVPAVLGAALVITQRPYSLILFHVVAWYIFALHQFKRYPPKAAVTRWWQWMRTTPAGFRVLHIGMVVVLMAIGLIWTLPLNQAAWLRWLLAPEAFLYWTIMHITVSFMPR